MSKGTVLVTDSLFIFPEHEAKLKQHGYDVMRIDKPEPSEAELLENIQGKVAYIHGGTETITNAVIEKADALKVIARCGISYRDYVSGWQLAAQKHIAITNTPTAPTQATAEWAVTVALAMNRRIFDLGQQGKESFITTPGLEGQRIGIIGFGHIGQRIAEMLQPFSVASIRYCVKSSTNESPAYAERTTLEEVLATSDIVFVAVSDQAGYDFINTQELALLKDGTLLISFVHVGIINEQALFNEVQSGRIRAASDYPLRSQKFTELPLSHWYGGNGSNAFNTVSETTLCSDMVVESVLNVLERGDDKFIVNKGD